MKLLTLNFLTCARKTCKSNAAAFPLHPREAELEQVETDLNPLFIQNILPRLDWEAMKTLSTEVCPPVLVLSFRFAPFIGGSIAKGGSYVRSSGSQTCPRRPRGPTSWPPQMGRRHRR